MVVIENTGGSGTIDFVGIPLLPAAGATDLLVLPHEPVFRRAPGCNHGVEFLGRCPQDVNLRLGDLLPGRNIAAEGLAMTSDGKRLSSLKIARRVLAELVVAAELFIPGLSCLRKRISMRKPEIICPALKSSDKTRSAPFSAAATISASQKEMRDSSSMRKAADISAVVISTHQTK